MDQYIYIEGGALKVREELLMEDLAGLTGNKIKVERVTDLNRIGLLEVDFLGHSMLVDESNIIFPILEKRRFYVALVFEKYIETVHSIVG